MTDMDLILPFSYSLLPKFAPPPHTHILLLFPFPFPHDVFLLSEWKRKKMIKIAEMIKFLSLVLLFLFSETLILAKLEMVRNTGFGMTLVTEFFLGFLETNPVVERFLRKKKQK